MSYSPEERERDQIRWAVDGALDGNHTIEQIRQELQNLNNTLETVRLCLEAIEQNTRISRLTDREWRSISVPFGNSDDQLNDLQRSGWNFHCVIETFGVTYLALFWRLPAETKPLKPEGDQPNV